MHTLQVIFCSPALQVRFTILYEHKVLDWLALCGVAAYHYVCQLR